MDIIFTGRLPGTKIKHPIISGPTYEDITHRIVFYISDGFANLALEVKFEDLVESRVKGLEYLKDFTISLWDNKKRLN